MDRYNGRALRALARQNMRYHRGLYRPVMLTLLGLLAASYFLQFFMGGVAMMTLGLASFPNMVTGAWVVDHAALTQLLSLGDMSHLAGNWGGIVATLRMDSAGVVMLLMMPWRILLSTALIQLASFLVMSFFHVAFPHQMDAVLGNRPQPALSGLLKKPAFWLKSWAVELPLALLHLLSTRLWLILLLSTFLLASLGLGFFPAVPLLLTGPLAFFLYTLLLPARYGLALHPGLGLFRGAKEGMALVKGRRKDFFKLCLSFWWYYLLTPFLANLPEAYVRPYQDTAILLFLHKACIPTPTV